MHRSAGIILAGLITLAGLAPAQGAEAECRAACAALPRGDRGRVLSCLAACRGPAAPDPVGAQRGSGFGTQTVAATPVPGGGTGWGAIYAAPAPSGGYGVIAGRGDRLTTHGRAEATCAARAEGLPCRMLVEFNAGCAAAAQASAGNRVVVTTAETGRSRQAAEQAALGACQARSAEACRVVQAACIN
jgi:hypothetical protein